MLKHFIFALIFALVLPVSAYATENRQTQKSRAQQLFEQSLEMLKPLSGSQIQEFRDFSTLEDEATAPAIPTLNTRTVRVTLETGQKPIKILTTPNTVSALVFHDTTGSPWEISSITNGSPSSFQILKPELPDSNLINILPLKSNVSTNVVVTFKNKDVPLIIALQSDNIKGNTRKADSMVLIQLAHMGPKALIPSIEKIEETVNSTMLAFLDQVPPDGAKLLKISPKIPNLKIWHYADKFYVRTQDLLIFPSWFASVNGAGNIKCYEIPQSTRILISINGKIQTIDLEV